MPTIKIKVDSLLSNQRFDIACTLSNKTSLLSRRKIRKIIDTGGAYLNNKRVLIASRIVKLNDTITLIYNEKELSSKKESFTLKQEDILFNNYGILAINKPALLPVQPTRTQSKEHVVTVVNNFLKQNPEFLKDKNNFDTSKKQNLHIALIHRLDKETSGVLLLSKNNNVNCDIVNLFKEKLIQKVYHAICFGKLDKKVEINSKLSSINPKTGCVKILPPSSLQGKPSSTIFVPYKYNKDLNISLIKAYPITGRTHQIRVHLESIGLVILGDKKYGQTLFIKEKQELNRILEESNISVQRQLLHDYEIKFKYHDVDIDIKAPYPKDFSTIYDFIYCL